MPSKTGSTYKIYMLSYKYSKSGLYCVNSDKKGFNEYQFYDGDLIDDWPESITFYFEGGPKQDFLIGGLHWMIISERVRNIFIEHDIYGVQFLPVKVIHNRTGEDLGLHWVMNVYQNVKKINWYEIRNMDIFRRSTSLFISAKLKNCLIKAKVTSGATFMGFADSIIGFE